MADMTRRLARLSAGRLQDWTIPGLWLMFFAVAWWSLTVGRFDVSFAEVWQGLAMRSGGTSSLILFEVRLPRIVASIMVGAALATAGAAYQGLFRNPMVSPDILGASAGAGFGAALAIMLEWNILAIQGASFLCGLIAVLTSCAIAARLRAGGDSVLTLVLVGIVVGSIFAAMISLLKYFADTYSKLPAITLWLMGSLSAINSRDVAFAAGPVAIGVFVLMRLRWQINVLAFGEEEAKALGAATDTLRWLIIACATLLTAVSVAIAGMVGWVGLVIPHCARMVVGPNYKLLLPASMLMGAIYLMLVDDLARTGYAIEIPLGIVTALIGAPFFLYLITKSRRGWV
jgi:iron complex transport system permease protein